MSNETFSRISKCEECRGCIRCEVRFCIYNSRGNPDNCYFSMCKYCNDELHKPRIMLDNVG